MKDSELIKIANATRSELNKPKRIMISGDPKTWKAFQKYCKDNNYISSKLIFAVMERYIEIGKKK